MLCCIPSGNSEVLVIHSEALVDTCYPPCFYLECLALLLNREIRSIRHKERRIVLYEMCRFVNGCLQNRKWENRRRQEINCSHQMLFDQGFRLPMLFVMPGIAVQNH